MIVGKILISRRASLAQLGDIGSTTHALLSHVHLYLQNLSEHLFASHRAAGSAILKRRT